MLVALAGNETTKLVLQYDQHMMQHIFTLFLCVTEHYGKKAHAPLPCAAGVSHTVPQVASTWHACPCPKSFSAPVEPVGQSSNEKLTSSRTAPLHHSAEANPGIKTGADWLHTDCMPTIHESVSEVRSVQYISCRRQENEGEPQAAYCQ